ncbi:MAG: hypothetical protein JNM07_09615 [Phycisphaerae bacterium]|nr:hypothetical protein [Phycisphaerae bacterium]
MSVTHDTFRQNIDRLKTDLAEQGLRVQSLIETAFEAVFARDPAGGPRVAAMDESIDRADVEIEKSAVRLLTAATAQSAGLGPEQLRLVLTIVKINNELERIADAGVGIAEAIPGNAAATIPVPETFRVLANSVIGILRDANTSFDKANPALARVVLLSEDAVGAFKQALIRETQAQLARGQISADLAFARLEIATFCQVMADHCTNIAEQVIYVASGSIVRHMKGQWEELPPPA